MLNVKFGTKLMLIIGSFSLATTLFVSLIDQHETRKTLIEKELEQRQLVEQNTLKAITDIDKAYTTFGRNVTEDMKKQLDTVNAEYKKHADVSKWDLESLKKEIGGYDIYLLNYETFVVDYTTYPTDLHLDFKKIAPSFVDGVKARVEDKKNTYWSDGLSLEDKTGKMKKYSYLLTEDKKYLLELGFNLEKGGIMTDFNFLDTTNQLEKDYSNVERIGVVSFDGRTLGKADKDGNVLMIEDKFMPTLKIMKEQRDAMRKENLDISVIKRQEISEEKDGNKLIHEFVPYDFVKDDGVHSQRIIEIVFNEKRLNDILAANQQRFLGQLAVNAVIGLAVSYIIARLVSRPMYLAFHDLLTGLSNRASFETVLTEKVRRRKENESLAVMVLDLDNFKKVNDNLGHDAGDFLLKDVGRRIKAALRNNEDVAFRLGGDEFTVVLSGMKDGKNAEEVAARIMEELARPLEVKGVDLAKTYNVSASIGIAIGPLHAKDGDGLYKKADIAMYHAKKSGKNAFKVYEEGME